MIEQILTWLRLLGFPNVEAEHLGPREGDMGLFCRGREVLWERQDILGDTLCRQKVVFLVDVRSRETDVLELGLLLEPMIQKTAPVFGEDQKILLEKGRTVKDNGGIPVKEFQMTVEYTTKEE